MVQWAKALASKSEDPSSRSRTHRMEKQNQLLRAVLWATTDILWHIYVKPLKCNLKNSLKLNKNVVLTPN